MVSKTIRFEQQRFGAWTNRISVLGGDPLGRSPLEQRAVETAVSFAAGRHLGKVNPRWRLTCNRRLS